MPAGPKSTNVHKHLRHHMASFRPLWGYIFQSISNYCEWMSKEPIPWSPQWALSLVVGARTMRTDRPRYCTSMVIGQWFYVIHRKQSTATWDIHEWSRMTVTMCPIKYAHRFCALFCCGYCSWDSYSISQEICTRFCCALLCCGYAIFHNEFTWSIYPYSSGLLCWHWGNR